MKKPYQIESQRAVKRLEEMAAEVAKYPAKDKAKIGAAVRALADDPFSSDVLKLEGASNAGGSAWAATGFFSAQSSAGRL